RPFSIRPVTLQLNWGVPNTNTKNFDSCYVGIIVINLTTGSVRSNFIDSNTYLIVPQCELQTVKAEFNLFVSAEDCIGKRRKSIRDNFCFGINKSKTYPIVLCVRLGFNIELKTYRRIVLNLITILRL